MLQYYLLFISNILKFEYYGSPYSELELTLHKFNNLVTDDCKRNSFTWQLSLLPLRHRIAELELVFRRFCRIFY